MHNSLAITIANAVLSDPTDATVRIYCKSLNQMELTASNEVPVTYMYMYGARRNNPKL